MKNEVLTASGLALINAVNNDSLKIIMTFQDLVQLNFIT